MATIDNLNFKVILDDSEFSSKVKRDMEEARRLNVQLSSLLSVKQKLNGISASASADARRAIDLEARRAQASAKTAAAEERVRAAVERTAREHQKLLTEQTKTAAMAERLAREQTRAADAAARYAERQKAVGGRAARTGNALSMSGGVLRQLSSLAAGYFSVAGVTRFLGSVMRVTGEFEMQREALRNIVQDVRGADALFDRLQNLAVESPYTFSEITTYAKQLSAFSVPLDDLYDTTKMLADVSAGLGVDMSRMILAYGQVKSAAFLRGQEVRQFTEAGVPLLQKLAEQFSQLEGRVVSVGEVFDKISKRQVSFEMVQKVLKDLTSEGGQFFDMQAVLADTLKGKVMKLKDAYEQMLFAVGESNSGFFHGAVDAALNVVRNYEDVGRALKGVIATLGAYGAAVLVTEFQNGRLLASLKELKLTKFIAANPYAAMVAGAVAAVAAISHVVAKVREHNEVFHVAEKTMSDYNAELASENSKLEYLWANLERATYGTRDYDEARRRLMKDYGTYLSNMDKERIMAGELAGAHDRLAAALERSMKARFLDAGMSALDEKVKDFMKELDDDFKETLKRGGVKDMGVSKALWDYIMGNSFDNFPEGEMKEKIMSALASLKDDVEVTSKSTYGGVSTSVTAGLDTMRKRSKEFIDMIDGQRDSLKAYLDAARQADEASELDPSGFTDFQRDVNAELERVFGETAKTSKYYISKNSVQIEDYIENLRSSYKKLGESVANASTAGYQDRDLETWRQEMREIEVAAGKLGVSLTEVKRKRDALAGDRLTDAQKRERDEINATVRTVEKLRDAYQRLRESIPEEMLGDAMKALFPDAPADLRDNADYDGQLRALSERLREIPGQAEAADRILTGMGEDATKSLTDAFAAAERFASAIGDLASKDFSIDGTGVAFKISKAVGDLRTKNAKVDSNMEGIKKDFAAAKSSELAMKALRVKYGEEFWEAYVARGEEALDELARKEKDYNTKKTQEQITQMASEYVKDAIKGKGIDLSDLSQKSLRQIAVLRGQIKAEIDGLDIGDLGLSEDTLKRLKESGLTLDDFAKAVKELFSAEDKKLSGEEKEKKYKRNAAAAEVAAQAVGRLGNALTELGEASGKAGLAQIGEQLTNLSGVISGTMAGAKSGGGVGAVVGFLTSAATVVTNIFIKEAKAREQARKANQAYTESLALLRSEMDETAYTSVFGESSFGKLTEALSKGRVAASEYGSALSDFRDAMSAFGDLGAFGLLGNNGALAALMPEIRGMEEYTRSLREAGASVWDEDGGFNVGAAKAYLDANYDIDDSLKSQIQHLIDLKERYDELLEAVDDVVESMTGSLAGDMVDAFLDNFKRVGDAVDDLDAAFENLGESIAKSMLQSFVQDELLKEFEPRFREMFEMYAGGAAGAEEVAAETGRLADEIRAKAEASAEFINRVLSGFSDAGLLGSETSGTSGSLSDGIKAVTEDTASLIASYMNAVRADVSYAKTQREAMLELLRNAFPASSPTLLEYLAQIQANTYDTAVATRDMLSEFRGVLAPHSEGGSGVKVVS